ncbi:MAG TPA: cytochrome C oxidase subunit IV family protein [Kofleriaceae bacterium]|jgi:cytochrome c oxidase subunit 4|nr:cytochrome C oxidase subunit IV family protein [Kofleriaceae bacterium]
MAIEHHDDHGHGLAHVAAPRVLLATGGTLLLLTLVTVVSSKIDFGGSSINLAIAMVIAVTKATLVVLFFMHLRYDRLFHSVVFVSAILAACLFVGFTLMDTGQYQHTNIWNPSAPPMAPIGPRPVNG